MQKPSIQVFRDATEVDPKRLAVDAITSVGKALGSVAPSGEQPYADYDRLAKEAAAAATPIVNYALDKEMDLSTTTVTMILFGVIFSPTPRSLLADAVVVLEPLWSPTPQERGSRAAHVLRRSLELVGQLGDLLTGSPVDPALAQRIRDGLLQVAYQTRADNESAARLCAFSASSFGLFDPALSEEPARLAMSTLVEGDDAETLVMVNALLAHTLARVSQGDPTRTVDAYEAFERTLHLAKMHDESLGPFEAAIDEWVTKSPYLAPLRPLLWTVLPEARRQPLNDMMAGLTGDLDVVLSGNPDQFVARIARIRDFTRAGEDFLLRFGPDSGGVQSSVDWATGAIRHRSLVSAVPHSTSFLREEQLHELILNLDHELTHVRSLQGAIGLALTAMRTAIYELELDILLAAGADEKANDLSEFVRSRRPVALSTDDPIVLACAERQAELQRKVQVLERIWEPWFEGLAVFGELAADPVMDTEAISDVATVLFNLWDRHPGNQTSSDRDAELARLRQHWESEWGKAEQLYSLALADRGSKRLRFYLGLDGRERYLAGYLAVRAVVASWRQTSPRELLGTEALSTLLHMTRHTDPADYLPDLSLPAEAFAREAERSVSRWLGQISRATADDLDAIAASYKDGRDSGIAYRWSGGALRRFVVDDEKQAAIEAEVHQQIDRAYAGGVDATVGGSAPLPPACERAAKLVEQRTVGANRPPQVARDSIQLAVSDLCLLPLGRARCRFWLNPEHRLLGCLVRTTEHDRTHGDANYDLVVMSFEDDVFASLLRSVRLHGDPSLLVTRIADLFDHGAGRGTGRNYIAFQHHDWIHIQPRGLRFGSSQVPESLRDDVREKLAPSELLGSYQRLTSATHAPAARTKSWLDEQDWTGSGLSVGIDSAPWAERTRRRAAEVLERAAHPRANSTPYLEFVFGEKDAGRALATFGDLEGAGGRIMQRLIQFLFDSGPRPIAADHDELADAVHEVVPTFLARTPRGWDVALPFERRQHASKTAGR